MESHKPKRVSSGSIKFYSADLTDLDNQDGKLKNIKEWNLPQAGMSRSSVRSHSSQRLSRAASTASSVGNAHQIKDWINQKSLQNIRDRHSVETYPTRQMYNRVLSNEENFVKGIDEFLKEQDLLNLRKKELLYKKWQEKVYFPLRKQVEKSIEQGFEPLDRQRRKEYLNYLNYNNKKGDVFLDVISAEEYNPLHLYGTTSPVALRARTRRLNDPLLTSERQRINEDKVVLRCETGVLHPDSVILSRKLPPSPLVPLGRQGTQCSTWLAMPLRDMESPVRNRSRLRMMSTSNASDIDFSNWSRNAFEPEIADRELRIQKKRRFEIPSTMPTPALLGNSEKASRVRFTNPPVTSTA